MRCLITYLFSSEIVLIVIAVSPLTKGFHWSQIPSSLLSIVAVSFKALRHSHTCHFWPAALLALQR